MKNFFIAVCMSIYLAACAGNSSVPHNIIKPEQMQQILWDVIKADVFAEETIKKDSLKKLSIESMKLTDEVFSAHHISRLQFENSFNFYMKRPDMFKTILDSLNAQQQRKNALNSKYKKPNNIKPAI